MKIYIYALVDPFTNKVRYVGKTENLKRRLSSHLSRSKLYKTHCYLWIKSLVEQDLKPIIMVLEESTIETWQIKEKFWIQYYKNLGEDLTNITDGGEGGATYGRLGKKNSSEHIRKTVEGRKGKKINFKPETNAKRSESIRKYYDSNRKAVLQFNDKGEFLRKWESAVFCGKELNINYANINKVCKGERQKAYGSIWIYEEDYKGQDLIIKPKNHPWNKGIPMSEDLKQKISLSKKGKGWTESRRIAQANKKEKNNEVS